MFSHNNIVSSDPVCFPDSLPFDEKLALAERHFFLKKKRINSLGFVHPVIRRVHSIDIAVIIRDFAM